MYFVDVYDKSTRLRNMSIYSHFIDILAAYVDIIDASPIYVEIFMIYRQVCSIGRSHRQVRDPVGTLAMC